MEKIVIDYNLNIYDNVNIYSFRCSCWNYICSFRRDKTMNDQQLFDTVNKNYIDNDLKCLRCEKPLMYCECLPLENPPIASLSDEEVHNSISKMTNTQSLFSMTGFSVKESPYKNRRDELIKTTVEDINRLRVGTKFKPITARWLSIKVNCNPFLKDDGELDFVIKECKRVGNYKKLFWLLK